ncbi:MAG: ATP-binding cassette domain-containing protein [Rhodoferax sp.]|nr:ATP-binding cassette domain-containing protein [Rhodoferax sp.]
MTATAVFSLQQVHLRFGKGAAEVEALRAVDLQIGAGERVALIGANGCGKSTLLRLLHGLLKPSSGEMQLGQSVQHGQRSGQAMLFQRPYMLRTTALNNVALGLWLRGSNWSAAQCAALHALQRMGLAEQAARPAHRLSGGQQQRVALARAWALQPHILLLDEPTSSLDPHAKREVETLIQQFSNANPNMTLVFASHNLGQVKRLASRVVYLEQGRVLADLPADTFFGAQVLQQQYPQAHAFVKGEPG